MKKSEIYIALECRTCKAEEIISQEEMEKMPAHYALVWTCEECRTVWAESLQINKDQAEF